MAKKRNNLGKKYGQKQKEQNKVLGAMSRLENKQGTSEDVFILHNVFDRIFTRTALFR